MRQGPATGPETCGNHPAVRATWRCESCGVCFCDECVVVKGTKLGRFEVCPRCDGMCVPFAPEGPRPTRSFFSLLPGAFSYPLRKGGWLLLLVGAVFFLVLDFLSRAPLVGVFVAVFTGGYLCAYMMKIIGSSAKGDEDLPPWPEFRDFWDDILAPFFSVLIVVACAFVPAGGYFLVASRGGALSAPVLLALGACGLLCIPMALIALTIFGLGGALNPFLVVGSIFRVLGQYLVACVVLAVLVGLRVASATYFAEFGLLVGPVVDGLLSLYFLIVEMRILGLIYYANEERLGWFRTG